MPPLPRLMSLSQTVPENMSRTRALWKKRRTTMRSATMENTEQLERCIEDCQGCHSICLQTINHCLDKGGRHTEAQQIRLLQDCVQICQTGADFMIRGSDRHGLTCFVCSEVCDACAGDCEQFQGDQQM